MSGQTSDKLHGVLAEYPTPKALYHACEEVRDLGYRDWDAFSPFPVHGLNRAMGLSPSPIPWIVLVMALGGALTAFAFQYWVHVVEYPLIFSAKPYNSWPAFIPITFEIAVLGGAFGAVFGMLHLNRLPRLHHPLFSSERFERVTDDRFFISVEATDPRFDPETTAQFLRSLGATHVELVEDVE